MPLATIFLDIAYMDSSLKVQHRVHVHIAFLELIYTIIEIFIQGWSFQNGISQPYDRQYIAYKRNNGNTNRSLLYVFRIFGEKEVSALKNFRNPSETSNVTSIRCDSMFTCRMMILLLIFSIF